MNRFKFLLVAALLAAAPVLAQAQVPSAQPVFNGKASHGTVLTLTAQGPGTVNSVDIVNAVGRGVFCTYFQTAHTGTPTSATFTIQMKDPISGANAQGSSNYLNMLTAPTNAGTSDGVAGTIQLGILIYPGAAGSAPTGITALQLPVPQRYRVAFTEAGAASTVTGSVSCQDLP